MCVKLRFNSQSAEIQHLKRVDERLCWLINEIGDIECNVHEDSYRFIIEEIIGQMLSNKMAYTLIRRFEDLCGGDVSSSRISDLKISDIREIGISNAKAKYIIDFSKLVDDGLFIFDDLEQMEDAEALKHLMQVKGIGAWTAKMYLLFVLGRPNILPVEDAAFLQGYKWLYQTDDVTPKSVKQCCAKWSPYSSVAARYLYRAVDYGYTKSPLNGF